MPFFKVSGNTIVRVDDSLGTIRNLTAFIETVGGIGKGVANLDITSFADSAERIIAGIEESGEVTLSGPWSDSATGNDAYLPALVGTIQTLEVNPAGTGAGARKITGEFLCMSYRMILDVKSAVRWESRHKLDGTLNSTGTN
jgi:hypothetical protein